MTATTHEPTTDGTLTNAEQLAITREKLAYVDDEIRRSKQAISGLCKAQAKEQAILTGLRRNRKALRQQLEERERAAAKRAVQP